VLQHRPAATGFPISSGIIRATDHSMLVLVLGRAAPFGLFSEDLVVDPRCEIRQPRSTPSGKLSWRS